MSQFDDDDSKPWTDHDLKEALRRINAGEINFKEAEDYYGISPRTIHRQRAIENMRAQLNPEKGKKGKPNHASSTKKDMTVLRKPVDISCSSINDVAALLDTGTDEVKQLLNYECDIIYECKVCKNLFRSVVNFISHKRIYCCDMYSVLHTRTDDGENGNEINEPAVENKIKFKENVKEFTAKPFRITCRKDLTSVLKRITAMADLAPLEPVLKVEPMENTPNAFLQTLINLQPPNANNESSSSNHEASVERNEISLETESKPEMTFSASKIQEKPDVHEKSSDYIAEKRFRCPVCASNFSLMRSVMRHLKAVHNQSSDQVARLKSRIQMHYVRKKFVTVVKKSSPAEKKTLLVEEKPALLANNSKTENANREPKKEEWMKDCVHCDRLFTNRNSYAAHSRRCRDNFRARMERTSTAESAARSKSLQPIVSLTPLASPSMIKSERHVDASSPSSTAAAAAAAAQQQSGTTNKKLACSAAAASSKKVSAGLAASALSTCPSWSSASKKIGIQVRMNYDKANTNSVAPTSINGNAAPTAAYPSTSVSVATSSSSSQSSANNSRRSSFAASSTRSDDLTNGQQPTSGHSRSSSSSAVLADILEKLLEKNDNAEEQTSAAPPKPAITTRQQQQRQSSPSATLESSRVAAADREAPSQSGAARKKVPRHRVTVYCEDCRTSYSLAAFKCDVASAGNGDGPAPTCGAGRSFRCALRYCDFKCNDKRQLLPHLNAKHAVLLEGDLAAVQSTFIAERAGTRASGCGNGGVSRPPAGASGDEKAARKYSVSVDSGVTPVAAQQQQQSSKPPPPAARLQPAKAPQPAKVAPQRSHSAPTAPAAAKRKPLNVKQSSATDKAEALTPAAADEDAPPPAKRRHFAEADASVGAALLGMAKKAKKAPVAGVATAAASKTSSAVTSSSTAPPSTTATDGKGKPFPRIRLRVKMGKPLGKPLVNGVGPAALDALSASSSDEENDLPAAAPAIASKTKCAGVLRKQNSSSLPAAKVVNCHNELSSSSSTPDSDLDPTTLTEENLKKSVMTIIFGKDMPTEKQDEREKSPSSLSDGSGSSSSGGGSGGSSSGSSSNGSIEKRCSVRLAKQSSSSAAAAATQQPVADCAKEDGKLMAAAAAAAAVANRAKATSR